MEGKIRGQGGRKARETDRVGEKNEKRGRWRARERLRRKGAIIPLLILDAEMTFDPAGPQVREKQTECLGKHMGSIYPLHMSKLHRCR